MSLPLNSQKERKKKNQRKERLSVSIPALKTTKLVDFSFCEVLGFVFFIFRLNPILKLTSQLQILKLIRSNQLN